MTHAPLHTPQIKYNLTRKHLSLPTLTRIHTPTDRNTYTFMYVLRSNVSNFTLPFFVNFLGSVIIVFFS